MIGRRNIPRSKDGLLRLCARCRRELPRDAFGPDKRTADGLGSWCGDCKAEYRRSWARSFADEVAAYNASRRKPPTSHICRSCGVHFTSWHPAAARCPDHREARVGRVRPWWQALYNGQWPKIRAAVLAAEPDCRICGAPADQVDHIAPLEDGGTHDRANLQPICVRCHARKTRRDIARRLGGAP